MPKPIRYTRTGVKDFTVRVKIRGKWKAAKASKTSFHIPKSATAYKVMLKTRARSVILSETKLPKRKRTAGTYLGKTRLLKSLQRRTPKPPKGEGAELLLDYLKRELGPNFGLSSGTLPQSLYASRYRFFTDKKELARKWLYVRIWYAIESSGMSDGSELPAGEKAWVIDSASAALPSPGRVLSEKLMKDYEDYTNAILYNVSDVQAEQGRVNRHNMDGRFKKWAPTAKFLGVEGDFRRADAEKLKAKKRRKQTAKQKRLSAMLEGATANDFFRASKTPAAAKRAGAGVKIPKAS